MAEVLVVGPASWNHIVDLDALPEPRPHMTFARGDYSTVGGTSAGKALHLVDLGRDVELATVLGTDDAGHRVESALRAAGIPLLLERTGPTERHLNLMAPDGGRVSVYLSVPDEPAPGALDAVVTAMGGARALVLDLSPRAARLIEPARGTGVPIWTDLHDYDGVAEFHAPFLAAADYVFCNADRLADPLELLRSVVAHGAKVAVCTLGADGAVAVDADGELRVAAEPVGAVVDVNGAGDGFLAGFLAATLDGAGPRAALRAGAQQAARALVSRHLSPLLDPVL